MIKVYFETENGSYAEEIATFSKEELYMKCKLVLVIEARKQGMILTEKTD